MLKWEIALAATSRLINTKQMLALKAEELEASCDGKGRTCDLWKHGCGCTVGFCRRVEA